MILIKKIRTIIWSICCIMFLLDIIACFFLNNSIAIHFSSDGNPNNYSNKFIIFIYPILPFLSMCIHGKYWKRSIEIDHQYYARKMDAIILIIIQIFLFIINVLTIVYNTNIISNETQNLSRIVNSSLITIFTGILVILGLVSLVYYSFTFKGNQRKRQIFELIMATAFLGLLLLGVYFNSFIWTIFAILFLCLVGGWISIKYPYHKGLKKGSICIIVALLLYLTLLFIILLNTSITTGTLYVLGATIVVLLFMDLITNYNKRR